MRGTARIEPGASTGNGSYRHRVNRHGAGQATDNGRPSSHHHHVERVEPASITTTGTDRQASEAIRKAPQPARSARPQDTGHRLLIPVQAAHHNEMMSPAVTE